MNFHLIAFKRLNYHIYVYLLLYCFRKLTIDEWQTIANEILRVTHKVIKELPESFKKKLKNYTQSAVERQFHYALGNFISEQNNNNNRKTKKTEM